MSEETSESGDPIYRSEMDLKLKMGAEHLDDLFEERQVTELLDPARPDVATPP